MFSSLGNLVSYLLMGFFEKLLGRGGLKLSRCQVITQISFYVVIGAGELAQRQVQVQRKVIEIRRWQLISATTSRA